MLLTLRRCAPVAVLVAALTACEDSPTAPSSYAHVADGRTWVAVAEPAGLPGVETWLPYLDGESEGGERVRALRAEAARARGAGRMEEARALEAAAFATAAGAMERSPDPRTVLRALAALESWVSRAEARLEETPDPGLAGAAEEVRSLHGAARSSLAAGDTAAAVEEITRAAAAARQWSPVAVGLRLLARVEGRLESGEASDDAHRRARRLLAGAREGLATGDSVRALRRALYALQVLETDSARRPVRPAAPVETVDPGAVPR